jgi:hypothetical protein
MDTRSPQPHRGHSRRLLATIVVAGAAAAVTAGVTMNARHPADPLLDGSMITNASAGESAVPSAAVANSADPSVPAAAEALQRAPGSGGEPSPTF